MDAWLEQRLVEDRTRELAAIARAGRRSRPDRAAVADMWLQLRAVPEPTPRLAPVECDPRRPVTRVVGEWLIRAGTRLGGATMQAS